MQLRIASRAWRGNLRRREAFEIQVQVTFMERRVNHVCTRRAAKWHCVIVGQETRKREEARVSGLMRYAIAAVCLAASVVAVAVLSPATTTFASDCAQRCYAQENSCRRATKDSPRCGAELTRCLQSCRAR